MDRYLVYGDEYKALRDAVAKAVLECKPLGIETALKVGWARGFSLIPGGIPWGLRVPWFMSNDAGWWTTDVAHHVTLYWKSRAHGLQGAPVRCV